MMEALRARLVEAIQAGEILRIAYHGGSQPGTAREMSPMVLTADSVLAEDLATGELRTFKLERIELLAPDAVVPAYDRTHEPEPRATLVETFGPYRSELEALGWHVELTEAHVSVGRFLKNGRPRKTPDVGLTFSPMTVDCFDDFDGRGPQEVERPSKRPFAVYSPGLSNTRTFTVLARAAMLFWQEARRQAPRGSAQSGG